MVFSGFEKFWDQNVGPPVAACATLFRPVAADWIPLILRFQILEAWIWRPGAWMPGCWKDWNGLEEVTEVTALWGEGIGRNSHTLKLQELGGYVCRCQRMWCYANFASTVRTFSQVYV